MAKEREERSPCPACPDGSVWNSSGPTSKICPVCKGHAVVQRNGAPIAADKKAGGEMSATTEAALRGWENDDRGDTPDDLHCHFNDFGRWDWCEIATEARRVWNMMFSGKLLDEDVQDDSPMDGVWGAAAAQASHGAFAAVAAALGVPARALELSLAEWYENQDNPPPPITPEELLKRCAENEQWIKDLRAGKFHE